MGIGAERSDVNESGAQWLICPRIADAPAPGQQFNLLSVPGASNQTIPFGQGGKCT